MRVLSKKLKMSVVMSRRWRFELHILYNFNLTIVQKRPKMVLDTRNSFAAISICTY